MAVLASPAVPSFETAPDLPDLGVVLQKARESRHLTIGDVADATNVRESYLQALEDELPLDSFPAPVYARFFLREYARFLGLEEEPLVRAQEARMGPVEQVIEVPPPAVPPPRRWVGAVLAAVALAGLLALTVSSLWPHAATTPTTVGSHRRVPALTPSPSSSPISVSKPHGMRAILTFSQPCWVSATADGKVLAERTFIAGVSVRLRARRTLTLRLGNAGGVDLRINGKRYPPGSGVVSLAFDLRNGRVVASG
jgi:cytoskeletal protein RodZ